MNDEDRHEYVLEMLSDLGEYQWEACVGYFVASMSPLMVHQVLQARAQRRVDSGLAASVPFAMWDLCEKLGLAIQPKRSANA